MDIIIDSMSDHTRRQLAEMISTGDRQGLVEWAKLLMVEPEQLITAVKLQEDQREDEIRRRANQTQFARAARGEQTRGEDALRVNQRERDMDYDRDRDYGYRRDFDRRDPYRRDYDGRFDGRYDGRFGGRGGFQFDPFGMVMDMQRRMRQPYGYQQYQYPPGYVQQPQGWYGYADEPMPGQQLSPLDGGMPYAADQMDDGPPPAANTTVMPKSQDSLSQPAAAAKQDKLPQAAAPAAGYTPSPGSVQFKIGDKPAVYVPKPNQQDLSMVLSHNGTKQKVNVGSSGKQIDAYVYEFNGTKYVVAAPN